MTEPCPDCASQHVFTKGCLGCAVKMVKSARPSRKQQEMMLAYLTMYCNVSREEILEAIKNDTITAVD
jgi:hypothetical protein